MERIGIVGATGLVGRSLLGKLLELGKLNPKKIELFSSQRTRGEQISVQGIKWLVQDLREAVLENVDVWFFASPPAVSKEWIPRILESSSAICLDGSPAFRMDPSVPLVVPEINGHLLKKGIRLVASPNCTTTLALMALFPLSQIFQLSRFWINSYQAVSGIGYSGIQELEGQVKAWAMGQEMPEPQFFPQKMAFNVIPHVGRYEGDSTEEESKLFQETIKILEAPKIKVFANCVRVPVLRCHSIAINAEFERKVTLDEAEAALSAFEGLKFHKEGYPTPLDYEGKTLCGVGRLRKDPALQNGLALWVVGDQILKGAALNMVQIFRRWVG